MTPPPSTAGYSGTPLARKLGIKAGATVALLDEPDDLRQLLTPVPDDVGFRTDLRARPDLVVAFFTRRSKLKARLPALTRAIHPDGGLWLAWPKKTSGVDTDLDGNGIRELGLAAGVVDIKVAAISEIWSGHRFAHRKANR
ncbi:MAG: DUF3052 domain-containing protein [Actinomycetota bacterium]